MGVNLIHFFRVCTAEMAVCIVRKRWKLKKQNYSTFEQRAGEAFKQYRVADEAFKQYTELHTLFLTAKDDGKHEERGTLFDQPYRIYGEFHPAPYMHCFD